MTRGSGRAAATSTCCAIVELRQYTLHPGRRDELIQLFDERLIEGQEAVGMTVIGPFRDMEDPDRFVWLRGFPDMKRRARSLAAFYDGPVWKTHRDAANSTMIDAGNVLLLHPARQGSGFALGDRPSSAERNASHPSMIVATIHYVAEAVDRSTSDAFGAALGPILDDAGGSLLATFVTDQSRNTFPRLPVRAGEHALVWFARLADTSASSGQVARLADLVRASMPKRLQGPVEVHRLLPTARSSLR